MGAALAFNELIYMNFPHKNWCRQFGLVVFLGTYFISKKKKKLITYVKIFWKRTLNVACLLPFCLLDSQSNVEGESAFFNSKFLYQISSVSISLSFFYFKNPGNSKRNKNLIWNTYSFILPASATLVTFFCDSFHSKIKLE